MENTFDKTAVETIDLLEARLRRIEYTLGGQCSEAMLPERTQSASQRISSLEHSLHQIASKSRVAQELLKLHSKNPDLFQSLPANELPMSQDTDTLLSIVLASASSYPSTASRLTSICDTPVPSADLSAQLIELQPRIAKMAVLQHAQNAEIAELRERSVAALQHWYQRDVLRSGEELAELESRVRMVEQKARRAAAVQRADENLV